MAFLSMKTSATVRKRETGADFEVARKERRRNQRNRCAASANKIGGNALGQSVMPIPGTAFQLVGDEFHRWIVISTVKDGKVLAVNVTDEANCPNSPCKVHVGDHPSNTKRSAI